MSYRSPPRRKGLDRHMYMAHREEQYARANREVLDAIREANAEAHVGNWDGAATRLSASLSVLAGMIANAREMHLLYEIREED